ncbi:hypothetical protein [Sedimentibacter sp.]|uniref:hypothetical protein n=1 Tax=Sedimentibacter sp. TaxID=1960295 RepID=UPI0028A69D7E|nr:hypothetical protein [Sedimentibacter sp.]
MADKLTRAKEIFIENLGSHDNMQETGCLQEYLQYNIPMEIEYNWTNEFITEQFSKADSKGIRISELISSVSFIVSHYGRYQDYKKLLAIKNMYLNGADLFELNIYFGNVLKSMRSLLENDNVPSNLKLEIVTELENMVVDTKENIASIPDKITGYITQKYNLQDPKRFTKASKLNQIHNEINTIKNLLLNFV